MSPVTRSYLYGITVGATVGLTLYAVPFVPWRVAAGAAVGISAVAVLFFRALLDLSFFDGSQHITPYDPDEWRTILAADGRHLREMAPRGGVRYRLRRPDEAHDDIPVTDLRVGSRRAGVR